MDFECLPGSAVLHVTGSVTKLDKSPSEEKTLREIMVELRMVYGENIPKAEGTPWTKYK